MEVNQVDGKVKETNEDNYVVDCTNEDCGWSGFQSETVSVSDEDSCPKCFFLVEPHEY